MNCNNKRSIGQNDSIKSKIMEYTIMTKSIRRKAMEDGYMKESEIESMEEKEREVELIKNIIKTRRELKNVDKNFEYAQDDLVDYYIYEMKANQAKLNYLIKMAKMKGITVDMINDIKYRLSSDEEVG